LKQPLNLISKNNYKEDGLNGFEEAIRWQIGYDKPLYQPGGGFYFYS
jgi:hypothetical protein